MLIRASEQDAQPEDDDIDPPDQQQSEDGEDQSDDPIGEDPEDDAPSDEQDQDPEPQRQQARGSDRIRNQAKLNREAREAREAAERRAADAERRAADAEARANAQRQADDAAQERAAMEVMSDQERTTYLLAKQVKTLQGNVGQAQLFNADTRDSSKFASYIAREQRFAKYADEVERIAGDAVAKGNFLSRDLILNQLIANDVRKGARNSERQRSDARKRVDNARGRSGSGRSDAGASARSGGKLTRTQRMERDDPAI